VVLHGFALPVETALLAGLREVIEEAPFRHMITPGGFRMSVAMTNCGLLGWVTDRSGYRYDPVDPESGRTWPRMPESWSSLAAAAAAEAGFAGFVPDACLVNRYDPGARLTLHQDRNERDFGQPIVSVSLGSGGLPVRWTAEDGKATGGWSSRTATLRYGADRPGSAITACCRSERGSPARGQASDQSHVSPGG